MNVYERVNMNMSSLPSGSLMFLNSSYYISNPN